MPFDTDVHPERATIIPSPLVPPSLRAICPGPDDTAPTTPLPRKVYAEGIPQIPHECVVEVIDDKDLCVSLHTLTPLFK